MQQEPKSGSVMDLLRKKLGIPKKGEKGDPKKVKIGSGLANKAKYAITSRQSQIDKQSGF